MTLISGGYDLSMRALRGISPLLERGESKLARGIRGRYGARELLSEWASVYRDRTRPLVWMHAPSVGEGLQARAVLKVLLEQREELQAAFTFFSPSALDMARAMPVHVAGYLPWDIRAEMDELLGVLDPRLVAFTKTEVWPGLTAAAASRGIPAVLVAATLPRSAGRLRGPARILLRPTFRTLSAVLAISDEDGERFLRLGVPEDRIEVTGDPGVDSAWQRVRGANLQAMHVSPFVAEPSPTLVAGSTWREDEEVLLPAIGELRRSVKGFRVVIAPHEPTEPVLFRLQSRLRELGFRTQRLDEVESRGRVGDADAILVNRVGVLAHLYRIGSVAFVGGGFGTDGLHSVIEPAAAGIPPVFGPNFENSRAAMELIHIGGGGSVRSGTELHHLLDSWFRDRRLMEEAGVRAAGYIEGHRGASLRTAKSLDRLLHFSHGMMN